MVSYLVFHVYTLISEMFLTAQSPGSQYSPGRPSHLTLSSSLLPLGRSVPLAQPDPALSVMEHAVRSFGFNTLPCLNQPLQFIRLYI